MSTEKRAAALPTIPTVELIFEFSGNLLDANRISNALQIEHTGIVFHLNSSTNKWIFSSGEVRALNILPVFEIMMRIFSPYKTETIKQIKKELGLTSHLYIKSRVCELIPVISIPDNVVSFLEETNTSVSFSVCPFLPRADSAPNRVKVQTELSVRRDLLETEVITEKLGLKPTVVKKMCDYPQVVLQRGNAREMWGHTSEPVMAEHGWWDKTEKELIHVLGPAKEFLKHLTETRHDCTLNVLLTMPDGIEHCKAYISTGFIHFLCDTSLTLGFCLV